MRKLLLFLIPAAAFSQGVQYTIHAGGTLGPTSISYDGFSYYSNESGLSLNISSVGFDGESSASGSGCTRTSSVADSWYQVACTNVTVRVTLSGSGTDTLAATVRVTNTHATKALVDIVSFFLPVNVTESAVHTRDTFNTTTNLGWHYAEVAQHWDYASGSHACYITEFEKLTVQCNINPSSTNRVKVANVEGYAPFTIPVGQHSEMTVYFRFAGPGTTLAQLAAPGYAAFQAAYPQGTIWEDRSMFGALFLSQYSWTSTTNPQGFRPNESADYVGAGFASARSALLSFVTSNLDIMDQYNPRPQAAIIWDIAGNEFPHVLTYDGNPQMLDVLAPAMLTETNGVALVDEVVRLIRSRGYGVGFTLRPSLIGSGTGRPTNACFSQATNEGQAYIRTDATWPDRGYRCVERDVTFDDEANTVACATTAHCAGLYDGNAVRLWGHSGGIVPTGITANETYYICNYNEGAGSYQIGTTAGCGTIITDLSGASGTVRHETWQKGNPSAQEALFLDAALDDLRMKLRYISRRWGARYTYIDTDNFCTQANYPYCRTGVSPIPIESWKTLQAEFPHILLIPEVSRQSGYTADFMSTNNGEVQRLSIQKRLWPDGFVIPHINTNGTTYLASYSAIVKSEMQDGVPYFMTTIEPPTGTSARRYFKDDQRLVAAHANAITITNTAVGRRRGWTANAYDSYQYPPKFRVAFRANDSFDGNETTYCEARSTARCWLNGVEQAAGTLNLTGYTHARREARAWQTNRLINAWAPEGL